MTNGTISLTLHYYLVTHPKITNFTWTEGQTPFSTPYFSTTVVAVYLSATLILRSAVCRGDLPTLNPKTLKLISAVHSLILFLLSLIMAVGSSLSIAAGKSPSFRLFCFPPGIPPSGPLFFWAYIFYLSKCLEFGDTFLIIMGKSIRRLSFLHVYHHATVLIMCYIWLHTCTSLFPVGVVTNSTVHVIMYGYYFLTSLGVRPRWKRLVTNFQILQFCFGFLVSGPTFYEHFAGSGCSGSTGLWFTAAFNASLLVLFYDFHSKNYPKNRLLVNLADEKRKRM